MAAIPPFRELAPRLGVHTAFLLSRADIWPSNKLIILHANRLKTCANVPSDFFTIVEMNLVCKKNNELVKSLEEAQKTINTVMAEGGTLLDQYRLDYASITLGEGIGEGSFGKSRDKEAFVSLVAHFTNSHCSLPPAQAQSTKASWRERASWP